jgi:hypothetical protein
MAKISHGGEKKRREDFTQRHKDTKDTEIGA